jgi:hypothetical protein
LKSDGPARAEERDERRASATGPLKAPPRTSGAPAHAIRCVRDAEGAKGATAGVSPLAAWCHSARRESESWRSRQSKYRLKTTLVVASMKLAPMLRSNTVSRRFLR